jgi:hypothetical protein
MNVGSSNNNNGIGQHGVQNIAAQVYGASANTQMTNGERDLILGNTHVNRE